MQFILDTYLFYRSCRRESEQNEDNPFHVSNGIRRLLAHTLHNCRLAAEDNY